MEKIVHRVAPREPIFFAFPSIGGARNVSSSSKEPKNGVVGLKAVEERDEYVRAGDTSGGDDWSLSEWDGYICGAL